MPVFFDVADKAGVFMLCVQGDWILQDVDVAPYGYLMHRTCGRRNVP